MVIFKASMASSLRSEVEVCQPTTQRLQKSMTKADPTDEGLDVGQIRHPQAVGAIGHELAVHQVSGPVLGLVGDGGPLKGLVSPGRSGAGHA